LLKIRAELSQFSGYSPQFSKKAIDLIRRRVRLYSGEIVSA